MTVQEFIEKMEAEGAAYALTDYGLSEDDLDPDVSDEFHQAVRDARMAFVQADRFIERIYVLADA